MTDSAGNTSDASVSVNSALTISPTNKSLGVNNEFTFAANGGVPPYSFSINSGSGTVTVSGDYKAPATSTAAVVRVTDSAGTTADANVTVNASLAINPVSSTVAAGGTQNFITAGGVSPYVYAVVSGGGSFSSSTYTAPSIASGASVAIVVTDSLGNTANATVTVNPITVAISSPNNTDIITASNQTSFVVNGTCTESGRVVNVSATGGISATPTCSSGSWTTNLNLTNAPDGAVTITANHSNVKSVAATPATVTLNKDGSNPSVTITTPTAGAYVTNSVTVTGTCVKQGPVNLSVTGGISAITTCDSGSYSRTLDLSSASDGGLTITVAHTDNAGNAATPATVNVTKDTVAPVITAFSVTNSNPTNTITYSLIFTATGTPSQYCILENSTSIGSCSWQNTPLPTAFTVSPTLNAKVLSAWVKDAAGNISSPRMDSNSVTLNTAPSITSVSPAYGSPDGGTSVTITGINFVNGAVAKIGTTNCTSTTFNSATSLTCVTPAGTVGAKNVVVTNPDTQVGTLNNGFTYAVSTTQTMTFNTTNSGNFTTSSANIIFDSTSVKLGASLPFAANVSFASAAQFQQENSNYTTFSGGAVSLLAPYAVNTPYYVYWEIRYDRQPRAETNFYNWYQIFGVV